MTDDTPRNGVSLDSIHALLVQQGTHLGSIDGRLGSIEAEVSVTRVEVGAQGRAMALLQQTCAARGAGCSARMKHLSDEVRRLGGDVAEAREETGEIYLSDVRRRTVWWTIAKIGGALLALAGLVTGAWGALRSCAGVQLLRGEVARQRQVQVRLVDEPWCVTGLADLHGLLERRLPHGEWMRLDTTDVPWPRWR
jgi:hypothetical protein